MEKKIIGYLIISIVGLAANVFTILSFFCVNPIKPGRGIVLETYTQRQIQYNNKLDSLCVSLNGKEVSNLWKARVVLNNNGRDVLIGESKASDIINDSMILSCPENCQLLSYYVVENDFAKSISERNDSVLINFRTWNPQGKLVVELMLNADEPLQSPPMIGLNKDCFKGIKIRQRQLDFSELTMESNNLNWLIRTKINFPRSIINIFKYVMICYGVLLIFFPFYGVYSTIVDAFENKRWKKLNYSSFKNKINALNIKDELKEQYINTPSSTPEEIQKDIDIDVPENKIGGDIGLIIVSFSFNPVGLLMFMFAKSLL